MGCILSLLVGIAARAWVGYLYVATNVLQTAFGSQILPLVGFVFMPLSTLSYAWAVTDPRGPNAPHMLLVGMCVLTDLFMIGISVRRRKR